MKVKPSSLIPKAFHPFWRAAVDPDILNIVCKGGRGSGKSSDITQILIQFTMRYPLNGVGIRKVENTIELSIFEQIKWAKAEQGVSSVQGEQIPNEGHLYTAW